MEYLILVVGYYIQYIYNMSFSLIVCPGRESESESKSVIVCSGTEWSDSEENYIAVTAGIALNNPARKSCHKTF